VKPLLVGLAPRIEGEPGAFAVSGSSSRRLAGLLGVDAEHLLDVVDAVNLSPEPLGSAPMSLWRELASALDLADRVVVACGRTVTAAIGGPSAWGAWVLSPPAVLTSAIPHPSGLCRAWNDPKMVKLGSQTLRAAVDIARYPVWRGCSIYRCCEEELCTT
jgi:hypothetical protein